jgi:uncharacterized protein YcbX
MRTVKFLYRYPIKGLSPESLQEVSMQTGQGFPGDRELAITNGRWPYEAAHYTPRPKTDFLMLMQHESLAALRTRVSNDGRRLTVQAPDGSFLDVALDNTTDLDRTSAFFAGYLGGRLEGCPRLIRAGGHRFTDVSVVSPTLMQSISIINLASVRDLGARMGREIDPMRFRANVYYDGGEPWEELTWIDREINLGDVRARAVLRTRRCAATNVDPVTGARDLGIPQALMKNFRHGDMGIYVELLGSGSLRPSDTLTPQT